MKIQRFFYGMVNNKIILLKTDRLNDILSDANFQFLRSLTPTDNNQWWLPAEQVIALSNIKEVSDGDGRKWVQNQTLVIPIHDYIKLTQPTQIFQKYFEPIQKETLEKWEPINIA